MSCYLVPTARILLLTGWLAGVFGRKRLLMASITGFTVASLLCGLAPTLGTLVGLRIVPGHTGGALGVVRIIQAQRRRRMPPARAGRTAGVVPAARARQGDGVLGARHRRGA